MRKLQLLLLALPGLAAGTVAAPMLQEHLLYCRTHRHVFLHRHLFFQRPVETRPAHSP